MQQNIANSQVVMTYLAVGKSLYIFSHKNPVRVILKKLVKWKYFDWVVLAIIIISSILLAIDNPLNDPEGDLAITIGYLDLIITILFTIECVIKIIVFGFAFNGPLSYLRNGWNVLDFLIVVLSLISLSSSGSGDLSKIKALRTFRVLRPLRLISRNENLRLVINALIRSIPNVGNVIIICVFFFTILGVICVNYLKGAMYY
jgi:hypothetical protein